MEEDFGLLVIYMTLVMIKWDIGYVGQETMVFKVQ